jgi:hypothetical protein
MVEYGCRSSSVDDFSTVHADANFVADFWFVMVWGVLGHGVVCQVGLSNGLGRFPGNHETFLTISEGM